MKATLKGTSISHKKLSTVADAVRKQKVDKALAHLSLMPKKGAKILHGVIASAAANAETNHGQKREDLVIDTIIINKAMVLKRSIPIARGSAHPLRKQTSHVEVTLKAEITEKKAKKVAKKEEVKEVATEEKATKKTTTKKAASTKKKAEAKAE